MTKLSTLLLMSFCWHSIVVEVPNASRGSLLQHTPPKIEVVYDSSRDKTTVALGPVQISGAKDKYHSLHMAPSFSYPGREERVPEIIDFELRTVVKGKLKIDLYVLFIVDGEEMFLSSSRRGVKKGRLGRGWMGEHMVFRMPYETFLRITRASSFEIKLGGIGFPLGVAQRKVLLDFVRQIKDSREKIN